MLHSDYRGTMKDYIKAIILTIVVYSITFVAFALLTSPNGDHTVYITSTGECYHKSGCSSLRYSKHPRTLERAVQGGYRSCNNCNPPEFIDESNDFSVPWWAYIVFTPLIAGVIWNISAFGIALLGVDVNRIKLGYIFIVHLILSLVLLISLNIFL